jgi:hypothetical protein
MGNSSPVYYRHNTRLVMGRSLAHQWLDVNCGVELAVSGMKYVDRGAVRGNFFRNIYLGWSWLCKALYVDASTGLASPWPYFPWPQSPSAESSRILAIRPCLTWQSFFSWHSPLNFRYVFREKRIKVVNMNCTPPPKKTISFPTQPRIRMPALLLATYIHPLAVLNSYTEACTKTTC